MGGRNKQQKQQRVVLEKAATPPEHTTQQQLHGGEGNRSVLCGKDKHSLPKMLCNQGSNDTGKQENGKSAYSLNKELQSGTTCTIPKG